MLNTNTKRLLCKCLSSAIACSVLFMSGCTAANPKEVVYYPNPSVSNVTSDVEDNETEEEIIEEVEEPVVIKNDSIRQNGTYEYEPTKLLVYLEEKDTKTDAMEEAILIMKAVDEVSPTVNFEGYNSDKIIVDLATEIASVSNPICSTISLEPDDGDTYKIIYQNEIDDQKKINEEFKLKIEEIINESIKPEYTDKQRTYALYRYLLDHYTIFYDEDCDNPAASILGDASSDLGVSALFTDSLSISDLTFIYAFLLNQVNIDARVIGCMGRYNDSDLSLLQDWYDTVSQPQWLWNVVKFSDEEAYHVDLGFEFLSSYDERGTELDKPYDVRFFGASDKTRGEYFDMWYSTDFFIVNPAESRNCPTCTEDMKDFEIDN